MTIPQLLTVGTIAKVLNVPIHRVDHIIHSRNIQPVARAGSLRIFTKTDLARIEHELGEKP